MKLGHLIRRHRAHEFRREIQRFVIKVESQPLSLPLVDMNVVAQHAEKGLRLLDHAGQFIQWYSHSSPIQFDANTQTRRINLLNSGVASVLRACSTCIPE